MNSAGQTSARYAGPGNSVGRPGAKSASLKKLVQKTAIARTAAPVEPVKRELPTFGPVGK